MPTCSKCNGSGWMGEWGTASSTTLPIELLPNWGLCQHCNGSGQEPESTVVRVPVYQYDIHATD